MGTIDTIVVRRYVIYRVPGAKALWLFVNPGRIIGRMSDWSAKRRSRLVLLHLTADQLRDIGLTHSDVRRELAKSSFWD